MIDFYGTKKNELIRNISDNLGRILSVEIKIEEVDFVLITRKLQKSCDFKFSLTSVAI